MSLQRKDDSRYDFEMPKFWDFTNSIPQERPDESWFSPANVSGPSFPWLHKKKRRALRVKHPLNKPAESHNQHAKAPVPKKPTSNVFDRLSTHSTISASKKMHPHISVEKGRPTPKMHAPPQTEHPSQSAEAIATQEDEQYQLDQDTNIEPVADRIARIEKELTSNKDAAFKRSNSNEESSQPSKIQKIINAQFSSLSSSLSFKRAIPTSRPSTATNTNITMKTTTAHPTQVEPPANVTASQLAPLQRPPTTNRRSLYNELQMQKTAPLQQNEKVRSSTPMPSSEVSSSSLPRPQASRPSITNRRSFYHELQFQNNGLSQHMERKPSSSPISPSRPAPLPLPQSQAPRPPSLILQSSQSPQSPHSPQSRMQSQPQPQMSFQPSPPSPRPQPQNNVPFKEAEATQTNDGTSTSDFFEDLLRARRKKANVHAPLHSKRNTDKFFDSLLKSSQEKHKSYHFLTPNALEEQEHRGAPSQASSIDMKQPKQRIDHKSASLPPHTVTTTSQHKEHGPELVPPPRLTQIYAPSNKQKYLLQEDRYFIDERIAKARKALRESKERTRKWLEALSPNRPLKQ
ncbi:tRNA-I(6)A37 thiotransferase enzyme MiaB [Mucor velutinosus]|uniref:tRNA-I(6)A37 thiotransferase enzyme MiaB n=1 Tax=Mucor velutinosus TaxID=708070 RepID=A0AAN7D721_9FUNG|nr:tRNA-I(6)A37 thiotransferase enzyme MiaB [Mucor velutinosus]